MSSDPAPPIVAERESVAAILLVDGRYALQLRARDPGIPYPAHWNLFGGGIDRGETPSEAVRREIHEELSFEVGNCQELWRVIGYSAFEDRLVRVIVFSSDVTETWKQRLLREGERDGLFDADDLPSPMVPLAEALVGRHHEAVAGDGRPLGRA